METTTLICPAPLRDQCATLCAALAGPAGAGMFVQPLYADSAEPSHYYSSGWIAEAFRDALPRTTINEEGEPVTRPADLPELVAMAASAGIETTEAALGALLQQCDVSDQPWRAAAARLGLSSKPIYPEVEA